MPGSSQTRSSGDPLADRPGKPLLEEAPSPPPRRRRSGGRPASCAALPACAPGSTSAPASATTPAIAGSPRSAVTSLTNDSARRQRQPARPPPSRCRSRVARGPRGPRRRASRAAAHRLGSTGSAPGRVDSPPTSTRSAPSAAMRSGVCHRGRGVQELASVRERVRRHVQDAHDRRTRKAGSDLRRLLALAAHLGGKAGARVWQRSRLRDRRGARARPAGRAAAPPARVHRTPPPADLPASSASNCSRSIVSCSSSSLREAVEVLAAVAQHLTRGLVRLLDDAADLVVDLARDLVRVVGRRR